MPYKYVIDRRTWLRGIGASSSRLLNDQGCRCCFGQILGQCGISDGIILNEAVIKFILGLISAEATQKIKHLLNDDQTAEDAWVIPAYALNDKVNIDDTERERDLTALFAVNGVELTFIN